MLGKAMQAGKVYKKCIHETRRHSRQPLNTPKMLPYKNPLGYRNLRTWQQANEIFEITEKYTATFPSKNPQTGQYLTDLKDQMIRSGRSVVRNIEEGFSRTTTKEYISFLGFSKGSLEELSADFQYCIKGKLGKIQWAEKGFWLCRGEGKMLHSQIMALEKKIGNEKTNTQNDRDINFLARRKQRQLEEEKYIKQLQSNGTG